MIHPTYGRIITPKILTSILLPPQARILIHGIVHRAHASSSGSQRCGEAHSWRALCSEGCGGARGVNASNMALVGTKVRELRKALGVVGKSGTRDAKAL